MKLASGVSLFCAGGAVALGVIYLVAAGAPVRHVAINVAAFAVGLAAFASVVLPNWRLGRMADLIPVALALVLLATALFGRPVDGAARWLPLGPLNLQVSLIVLPAMLVAFARRPGLGGAAGLSIAAVALALQPDRAMAGALTAGLAAFAVRREPVVLLTLAVAAAAFAATLLQPDRLPAIPYVDQVFFTAFAVGPLIGAAVIGGACLLLVPAFRGGGHAPALVFGGVWLAVIVAAVLGNFPTPVVAYGGSAIVGYLLSLAILCAPVDGREAVGGVASRIATHGDDAKLFAAC